MKNIRYMLAGIMVLFALVLPVQAEEVVEEETGKWSKAGEDIKEAAHSVGDATADSSQKAWKSGKEGSAEAWDATKEGSAKAWDKTKEGSAEAWDATKEKSKSAWEKGKEKIHEATAPEAAEPEGD